MHQDDVVIEIFPRAIDAVNIVRLIIDRVLDKGKMKRQLQGSTVLNQYTVIVTGGDHHLFDSRFSDHPQLPGKDRLPGRYFRHAFRMFGGQYPHPGTKPGV